MASLKDDTRLDAEVHASDHILSPQPYAPPSKELLMASLEKSHLPSEVESTIDDGQMSMQSYEYNSSGSSARHSTSDIFGREMDDELDQLKSRASSRSSWSSIPASVLIHPVDHLKAIPSMNTSMNMNTLEEDEASFGGFDGPPRSIRTIRQREAAFRKPSSVRAMQMHTEDEADEDDYMTLPRRRPGMRSPGSSPLKRSPYYSPNASPSKPKPKKEYPLVLLHCTLLAPSLPVPSASEPQNQKIVEEVLPSQYWKRWRRLQEKVGSGVLRDRGVLISHPEDLYDVLEERLLESLELQRARLHQGHFIAHEDSGPGSEGELSDHGESETDGEQGDECPDCGGRVLRHDDINRKWEIRVFAANGLMRAGAWAAAWKEMEKVDVEVGLWLPSDVRRALEKRLSEEAVTTSMEESPCSPKVDRLSDLDVDPQRPFVQTHSRNLSGVSSFQPSNSSTKPTLGEAIPDHTEVKQQKPEHEIALGTLLINYIRVLAGDKRNIALLVMSILTVFLAIGSQAQQQPLLQVIQSFAPNPIQTLQAPILDRVMPSQSTISVPPFIPATESLVDSIVPTSSTAVSASILGQSVFSRVEEAPIRSVIAEPEIELVDPEQTVSFIASEPSETIIEHGQQEESQPKQPESMDPPVELREEEAHHTGPEPTMLSTTSEPSDLVSEPEQLEEAGLDDPDALNPQAEALENEAHPAQPEPEPAPEE
ncbi:hypothetical protein N7462_006005 [Penicillium macrosclerotiorum]|uniref:uncharacterized protein n=1 Tax=Penicillium macrosclerotiorum TaxID=303699 RepID=UPI002548A0FA|nr:uncharacterized protein N7462_006005 [Penicillium macrosclerotiorum]KAJ5682840.1 hypothetical protein N7462_006005 [Penicillium macrosclerotiorum]